MKKRQHSRPKMAKMSRRFGNQGSAPSAIPGSFGESCPPWRCFLAAVIALAAIGCEKPAESSHAEFRTEAVCEGGASAYEGTVEYHLTEIGPSGNDIAYADDAMWIVESDANTTSRFGLMGESMDAGFVDVGNDRNPYGLAVDEATRELWIANFLSHSVTVADMDSGEVLVEIDDPSMDNPSAVAVTDDYAYIANVAFISTEDGYAPGSITVVDRSDHRVVSTVATEFKNPQFLSIEDIDGRTTLLVSGSGAVSFDDATFGVESEGGLEWLDIEDDPVEPDGQSFAIGQDRAGDVGAPGRPLLTPDAQRIYFSSAIAPVVFAFDTDQKQWIYDAEQPLQLYDTTGDATHRAAMGPDGLLWITAFNEDRLHLVDTACDKEVTDPIDVGAVGDMLEGPQAVTAVDGQHHIQGFYLLSLANAMGRITLRPVDS